MFHFWNKSWIWPFEAFGRLFSCSWETSYSPRLQYDHFFSLGWRTRHYKNRKIKRFHLLNKSTAFNSLLYPFIHIHFQKAQVAVIKSCKGFLYGHQYVQYVQSNNWTFPLTHHGWFWHCISYITSQNRYWFMLSKISKIFLLLKKGNTLQCWSTTHWQIGRK